MIHGKTRTGFEFEVDPAVLDDMELLDAIVEIEEKPFGVSKVLRMVLGDQQRKALYEHLRNEMGRVPVQAVMDAIIDIFTSGKEGKN